MNKYENHSSRWTLACLAALLAVGAIVRLWNLGGTSLWLDEILQLRCTGQPLGAIWECSPPNKPPLDYYIQGLVVNQFPAEWLARLHAWFFGAGFLAAAAWLAWRLGGAGLAFAALLAILLSPVHIRFSQEGRPYALMMFTEAVFLAALWSFAHGRRWERWGGWLGVTGAAALAVWAFYANLIVIALAILLLIIAVMGRREARRKLITALGSRRTWMFLGVSLALAALALLPLALRTAERFDPSQRNHWGGWSLPLMLNYLDMFACGYDWYLYRDEAVWMSAAYAAVGLIGGLARRRTRLAAIMIAALFAGTFWGTFALYAAMDQYLEMRYTLIAFLPLSLLVALGIWVAGDGAARLIARRLNRGPETPRLVLAMCVAAAAPWLIMQGSFLAARGAPRSDWRGLAERIQREADAASIVYVGDFLDDIPLRYYFERYQIPTPIFVSDYNPVEPARIIETGRDVWIVVREKTAPAEFWASLPEAEAENYFLLEVRRYNTREGGAP